MFSSTSVCLLTWLRRNYSSDFQKFGGKVAHVPGKKPLHFGGNPNYITLELELEICDTEYVSRDVSLTATIYSGSSALAEVCALVSLRTGLIYFQPLLVVEWLRRWTCAQ